MMRHISRIPALIWIPAVLALGFSLPSHAQTPLGGFGIGVSPNPAGYGNEAIEVSGFVVGSPDGNNPDGSVDLFVSTSTTSCNNILDDFGPQTLSAQSSYEEVQYSFAPEDWGISSGIVPICATYTSSESGYASQTSGPILLTLYSPTTLSTYAAPQPVWGNPYSLYFVLSYNAGQPAPTGTITLYNDVNNQVGSPVTVGPITLPNSQSAIGAVIANPNFTDLTSPVTYNYSASFISGDTNYVSQNAAGSLFFVNPLSSVIPASVTVGPILTASDTQCTVPTNAAQGLLVTLNGFDFNGNTVAQIPINGALVQLATTLISSTQLTACVPNTFLTTVGSVPINVNVSGSTPVTLQVAPPYAVTLADTASPLTFPWGQSLVSTLLTGTATRTSANDAAVPIGTVSFTLNSTIDGGISYSLGSSSLSTVSTQGTYINPATTNPPYEATIDSNLTQKTIAADLNLDGYVDVVGLPGSYPGNTAAGPYLQIFLSTGADAFQAEQQVYVGCAPQDFAVGDIHDTQTNGIPDLVVICPQTQSAVLQGYYLLGNGDGTFQSPIAFTSNIPYWDPSFVVLGQFNGDGLNEIAVIDSYDDQMQVISPFGTPTYGPQVYFTGNYGNVIGAGVADFNQDNLSDIALEEYIAPNQESDSDGSGAVLIYTSLGSYNGVGYGFELDSTANFYAGSYFNLGMAITSLEGDNWPDVAIADPGGADNYMGTFDTGSIQVFVNARDYSGNLSSPVIFQPSTVSNEGAVAGPPLPVAAYLPLSSAVAPGWNLVFSYPAASGTNTDTWVGELQYNASQNTLTQVNAIDTGTQIYPTEGGAQPGYIVAADMNGDGFLDYAATGYVANDSYPSGIEAELVPYYYGDDAQTSTFANAAQPLNGSPAIPPPGNYTLNLTYPGNQLFQANNTATTQAQITITQATPVVTTWPTASSITYGQTLASSTLSGGVSNPAGTFAWTTPTTAPGVGAQSESVTFTPTDTTDYSPVTGLVTVNVGQATPTVSTWPTASAITYGQTLASSTLSGGVSTPAGTFAWTAPTTAPGAGAQTESVTFTPNNATDYTTLTGTVTVNVGKATPTVTTWPTASSITYGQTLASSTLSGGVSTPAGTFAWTTPATAPAAGAQPESVTFTPTDTIDYTTLTGAVTVNVGKATPTVTTWPTASSITFGQTLAASTLSGGASTPAGTFAWTTPATAPGAGSQPESVTFTPANATDYATLTGTVTVAVSKATSTVTTWPTASGISYGQTLASSTLSGGVSTPPGTFAWTTPTIAPPAGAQSESVTFTPTDSADYTVLSAPVTVNVSKAASTVTTWPTASGINYGQTLASSTLSGGVSNPAGTFTWTTPTTAPGAGAQSEGVTFTPTNTTDYTSLTGTVTVTVSKATPTITWATPAAIPYGTALSGTQLDATASFNSVTVPGTFAYTPASGTVLNGGVGQTLSVIFTPTDTTDFATPPAATTTITVNPATPTITWSAPAAITYGTALSAAQLDATATFGGVTVPGTFTYTPASGTVLSGGSGQTLSVIFRPANTANFATPAPVTTTINVNAAAPTISWPAPAAITYGTALSATQLDATATFGGVAVPGTFVYTPASGTVLNSGNGQTLSVIFTPANTADFATPAPVTTTINVNQATPTITWPAPAAITYGTALSATQLDATATFGGVTVPGTFVYTPAAGTVLSGGSGQTLSVIFTPTNTTNFATPAAATTTIDVNPITPTITWPAPAAIAYGTPLSAVQLNASSTVPGTFAYTPAAGAILNPGTQTLSVTLTPTNGADYTTATKTVSLTVNPPSGSNPSLTENVGTESSAQAVTIQIVSNFTLGSVSVVTQGAPDLDFNLVPGGTCLLGTAYTSGQVCTVNYTFKPTAPGTRLGAILLYDNTSPTPVLEATVLLSGTGVGPQVNFLPGAMTTLAAGLGTQIGDFVAVDGSGNVYVLDEDDHTLYKETLSNGSYAQSTIDSSFASPFGVAVDGGGSVYVTDQGTQALYKETPSNGQYTKSEIVSGFSVPYGVAVDSAGNAYVEDAGFKEVFKETLTAGGYTQSTIVTGLINPQTIAVDGSGNVYLTDEGNSNLYEETLSNGTYTQTTIGSGYFSVAVGGTGQIYAGGFNSSNQMYVSELTPSDGQYTTTAIGGQLGVATSLAVDSAGNAYVADRGANVNGVTYPIAVYKIDLSDPPSLSFATTAVGSTSSDSPQTVTVANIGNAPLTLSVPTSGNNPSISPNFTLNSSVTSACPLLTSDSSAGTLAAGASCLLPVSFTPTAVGSLTGTLGLTDNSLNVTNAMQTIPLNGAGVTGTTTSLGSSLNPSIFGGSVTFTATVAATGGTSTPTGTVQFSVDGNTVGSPVTLSGVTAQYTTSGLTGGPHSITAVYTPAAGSDFLTSSAPALSEVVNKATTTVAWAAPTAITYGTALSTTQLDATSSLPGTFTYNPASGAVLNAGSNTLSVTFTPTDTTDYQASTSSVSLLVNQATPAIIWPSHETITYGTQLSSSLLNATASTAGSFAYNPVAGTILPAGTHTLLATFTPTDTTDYITTTATMTVQVNQATPVITWPSPGNISSGTPLGSTQLDATATPAGGTFTYLPPAGTTLPVGTDTLTVTYTPLDTVDYSTATATTSVNVIAGLTLTSIVPTSAPYGSAVTPITVTGTGFTPSSIVQLNGTAIASTYTSPTQLTAQIPASFFQQLTAGTITVYDPVNQITTTSATFTVSLPNVKVTFSGPSTAAPGEQPTLNLSISQPYPIDIQGTMTLTVDPLTPGGPTDPAVQFSTGGTTLTFTIAAGTTTTPTIQIQTGTIASNIYVNLTLQANGQDIQAPSTVEVTVPKAAPVITSVTLVPSGNTLTVTVEGYSSTRDMNQATFDFRAAPGSTVTISDPEIFVDVSSEFTTWYSSDASTQYGSSFTYSQVFNLSNSASTIGSVSVVLTNSVGQSNQVTAQ